MSEKRTATPADVEERSRKIAETRHGLSEEHAAANDADADGSTENALEAARDLGYELPELVEGELVPESGEVIGWIIRDGGIIRADARTDCREPITTEETVALIGILIGDLPPTVEAATMLMQEMQRVAQAAPAAPDPV